VTALSQSIKRKLSLLQLAEELGNVARACKIMGYHRDTFYEVRRAFQTGGVAGLVESHRGARGPHPNRLAPEVEAKVLDYCLQRPTHGVFVRPTPLDRRVLRSVQQRRAPAVRQQLLDAACRVDR
jgi:hypothetical protein